MELEAFLLQEVRYRIPKRLLLLLGDDYLLTLKVEGYLNEVRKMTDHDVPKQLWHHTEKYVTALVKYEIYSTAVGMPKSDKRWEELEPNFKELVHEYIDQHDEAMGKSVTIMTIWNNYYRRVRNG